MRGSGIAWPPGPYRLPQRRQRLWLLAGACALILVAVIMVAAHGRDRWLPQDLADLGATIGLGTEVPGAAVESWNCGPYQRDTFWERSQRGIRHECLIRVRGAVQTDYEFRTGYSAAYDPGRVARIGGRIAVAWPGWVMFERLTSFGVTFVMSLLIVVFAAFMLLAGRAAKRFEAPDARIVDVDLLCRKMLQRGALWDFAYDFAGRRVLAQALVREDPVVTDGVVTRGAAVIERGGEALLLTREQARQFLPPDVDRAIDAAFHGYRTPLDQGFDALLARWPEGAERDYLLAFWHAWHDPDVAKVNAAILARHDAALALGPERADALYRECRRYIVEG